uniref:Uncharacterized protein n=1 Tax=Solanum lycopersicum TaxID=4081 RepID=A0A3Q7J9X0_SOLLC
MCKAGLIVKKLEKHEEMVNASTMRNVLFMLNLVKMWTETHRRKDGSYVTEEAKEMGAVVGSLVLLYIYVGEAEISLFCLSPLYPVLIFSVYRESSVVRRRERRAREKQIVSMASPSKHRKPQMINIVIEGMNSLKQKSDPSHFDKQDRSYSSSGH